MTGSVRKAALCLASILIATLLWGCTQDAPDSSSKPTKPSTIATTLPLETTTPAPVPLSSDMFTYEAIPFPEEITTAYHVYLCYANQTHSILSVCSRIYGVYEGPLQKTDFLALCDYEGNVTAYPVDSDAYIVSAIPYEAGILYVDYTLRNDEQPYAWSLIYTDKLQTTVLDTGSIDAHDRMPLLFYLEDIPHYLVRQENGYCIRQIHAFSASTVHSETDCKLADTEVAYNGKEFCFLVKYPQDDFACFCIWNTDGLKYQCKLSEMGVSCTITDQYALCTTRTGETEQYSMEVVNLATGNTSIFKQPGAFYGHAGTGAVCVSVDKEWQPHALDINSQQIVEIEPPERYRSGRPIYFAPAGEDCLFVEYQVYENYSFYLLHISK